jgi:hypothetical protein
MKLTAFLTFSFRPSRQRPVREAKPAAHSIQYRIDTKRCDVRFVPKEREPLGMSDDDIELIPMDHQIPPVVSSLVHNTIGHLDATEVGTQKASEELIVIARDVNDYAIPCGPCGGSSEPHRCEAVANTTIASIANHPRYRRQGKLSRRHCPSGSQAEDLPGSRACPSGHLK